MPCYLLAGGAEVPELTAAVDEAAGVDRLAGADGLAAALVFLAGHVGRKAVVEVLAADADGGLIVGSPVR